ncbi:MAG: gliding motility-associated C-terminal domain-containing protein [Vicingaceae bacterium]|nr:gliding motility-associated C-terminal domain-containing protein [Vicingaceae bacterium]
MILRYWFIIFFITIVEQSYSQNGYLYYRDQFRGGVSSDGYSPDAGFGGIGNINIYILPGSIIKRAFLFAGRQGNAQNVNVIFNGNNLSFDSTNQITSNFFSPFGGNSALHVVEVTQYVSPIQLNYQLIVPQQSNNTANRYTDFYLYVAYENNLLNEVTTNIYLNQMGFNNDIRTYNISPINKINNSFDVGIAIFSGYLCDTIEGENIYVNNNYLGLIGLPDINSGSCGGTKGSFYYENNTLFGLQDDTANIKMTGSDALSEVSAYTINNDTSISVRFQTEFNTNNTNAIWGIFTTYTSNCSFTTTTTAPQDTICLGDSVQLSATGGSTYSWFGVPIAIGSGLSDTTIANPLASPPQTTTYIVTIKNDSGCVKTEHIKIWVNPLPTPTNIITTNTLCNDSSGNLTVGIINSNTAPYSYTLTNLETSNTITQAQNTFNNLGNATYLLQIIDINGCSVTDTILINDVQVGCDVSDTLELMITIPNVFTPNGDNENDNFVIQIIGAELLESLETKIFNRWGQTVENRKWKVESLETLPLTNNQQQFTIWNGNTTAANEASEGTYFYIISYTTKAGETVTEKGSVTLLR